MNTDDLVFDGYVFKTLFPVLGRVEPDGMTLCIPEWTKGTTNGNRSQFATNLPMPILMGNSSPFLLLVPSTKQGN